MTSRERAREPFKESVAFFARCEFPIMRHPPNPLICFQFQFNSQLSFLVFTPRSYLLPLFYGKPYVNPSLRSGPVHHISKSLLCSSLYFSIPYGFPLRTGGGLLYPIKSVISLVIYGVFSVPSRIASFVPVDLSPE